MKVRRWFRWIACLAVIVVALAASSSAHAQGCALCYNTAAAAKASGIRALKNGIVILLVTPLIICSGIILLGFRARNRFNGPEGWSDEPEAGEAFERLAPLEPSGAKWNEEGPLDRATAEALP